MSTTGATGSHPAVRICLPFKNIVTLPLSHHVAIVAARIPRFATLAPEDRLRAAALALWRDYGVERTSLQLATRALSSDLSDELVLIAYSTANSGATSVDFSWLPHAINGDIFWIANNDDRQESLVLSEQGAARIQAWRTGDDVPDALLSLASARMRAKQSVRVVLVERDGRHIDDKALVLWSASLGVLFERGLLPTSNDLAPLQAVPVPRTRTTNTGFDRALLSALCAALVCVAIAAWRLASVPSAASIANAIPARAGALWARATLAAPQLVEHGRSATFGGGAWVVAAPTLPATALPGIDSALSANALASQIVREPEIRIRVQQP